MRIVDLSLPINSRMTGLPGIQTYLVNPTRCFPLSVMSEAQAAMLRRRGIEIEGMAMVLEKLCQGLIRLDRQLEKSGGPWLLGDFTLPDITMMACFHRLEDVRLDDILQESLVPRLGSYWERLQARPSYRTAITDMHDEENFRTAIVDVFGDGKSPQLDDARETLKRLSG